MMKPRDFITAVVLAASLVGCTRGAGPDGVPDGGMPGVDAPMGTDGGPLPDVPRPDAPTPDATCASVIVDTTPTTPNVMFVIDRSGSMENMLVPGYSRWDVLESALLGAPDGIVTLLEHDVRFGAAMYTVDPTVPAASRVCPEMRSVPAIIDGHSAIQSLFSSTRPWGSTPTGDAIEHVVANADTLIPSRGTDPTIIVLATDGEPGSCGDLADIDIGRALVLDRVSAAHSVGIDTFVLSVGAEIANAHLQDVANAGVGHVAGTPDAPYWVASDASGLADALRSIVGRVVSCQLVLDGMIEMDYACTGTVTLGSDELTCDTDWRAVDETHIEILGAACDRLQAGGEELVARFPCDILI